MSEFDFIKNNFLSIAAKDLSLNLKDDAAILPKNEFEDYVISKDCISESTSFFPDDPPELIAKKLLRTNISDIAAMGAKPEYFLIGNMFSSTSDSNWRERFVAGLVEDAKLNNIKLLGGDINFSSSNYNHFSMTIIGLVSKGNHLTRSGAKPNQLICVSGNIGDSYMGLLAKQGKIQLSSEDYGYFYNKYLLPPVRTEVGLQLSGKASACMDISDGLLQDLNHISNCSGVACNVYLDKIPLSKKLNTVLSSMSLSKKDFVNSGDDYELLFTISPEYLEELKHLDIVVLGETVSGTGVHLIDNDGKEIEYNSGYQHKL